MSNKRRHYEIESASVERVPFVVTTPEDPTDHGAPSFQLTDTEESSPASGAWASGSWGGNYVPRTKQVEALSPPIGVTGATPTPSITVEEGATYWVWVRWSPTADGSERPATQVGTLRVR